VELAEINLAKANPDQTLDSLLNKLTKNFDGQPITRKKAMDILDINRSTWEKLYKRGQKKGIMKSVGNHWEIESQNLT
jgi:hypothetical protein